MLWGVGDLQEELGHVQGLRADPPALANAPGRRRKVFGYALQQFGELLVASSSVEPSSSAITLFYALSQAGRAIAAAFCSGPGDRYAYRGHGLRVIEAEPIGNTRVEPDPTGNDAFTVVSESTGSPVLTAGTTVSELWGSLPHLSPAQGLGDRSPKVRALESDVVRVPGEPMRAGMLRLTPEESERGLDAVLADYPRARDWQHGGGVQHSHDGTFVLFRIHWLDGGIDVAVSTVHESYFGDEVFYLRPAVNDAGDLPSILMTFWALTLALSSVARYAPEVWGRALDHDQSPVAVPLRQAIGRFQLTMPRLVRHALTGSWTV